MKKAEIHNPFNRNPSGGKSLKKTEKTQKAKSLKNHISIKVQNKKYKKLQEKKQVQTQKQNKKSQQIHQLTEDNINCKLCYRYAKNAVQCKNQKCNILLCSDCAKRSMQKVDNRCPYCRVQPFKVIESPFRSRIDRTKLQCQLCKQKYELKEEENHYKKECRYFLTVSCEYCDQRVQKKEIGKHTRIKHQDQLEEIIEQIYSNPKPIFNSKVLLNKQKYYLNIINKTPHIGISGKFYCGSALGGPKCSCCDGYCGPTNGENCLECMRLDMKRLGLPNGCLLNTGGMVCWREGQQFLCGKMMSSEDIYGCREGSSCNDCRKMTKNKERYLDLL